MIQNICRSKEAPFLSTLAIIGGKWKMRILYELSCDSILRYGVLKRNLVPITHKMLSTQLKELEKDGMIIRKEYPQVPPKGKITSLIVASFCQTLVAYAAAAYISFAVL